ncbi:MAG TPA: glycosyl hydrolase [Abditibacterium sp.]
MQAPFKRALRRLTVAALLVTGGCFLTPTPARAADPVTPNASPEAKALLNYLYAMKGKKVLSGQMYAPWGNDEIKITHDITGKYPALRGGDYITESANKRENQLLLDWWKAGGIPTMMWHWGAPSKGEGYEQSKLEIDIDKCFVPGTPEHTAMWADLKRIADHLTVLRDAKVPIIWRPMHENDGNWFWYGKQGGEKFNRVWRTMFDYFVHERKLNNLIWVLGHTGDPKADWNPGRQYYDIAGGDTYARNSNPQTALYKKVTAIHGDSMPIAFHEVGILPEPEAMFKEGANWSWWMLWHTSHLNNHNKEDLKRIYNHELVITRDELPNIMNYVDSESGIVKTAAVAAMKPAPAKAAPAKPVAPKAAPAKAAAPMTFYRREAWATANR